MEERALVGQALRQESTPAWELERDLACRLEEMVSGPPRPTGGDDDDLRLILPYLDQRPLEEQDRGKGVEGQPRPWLGQRV